VTAFHPDYKMTDRGATPASQLVRAAEIGTEEGLRYVYAGNLPGRVGKWEHTRCPKCAATVIERWGFEVLANRLIDGACPDCATPIPGRWDPKVQGTTRTHGIPLAVV
jgi:pyruvate formate lyase activating enzyme